MSDPARPDFRITIRDLAPPGDATTDVRLRRLLKFALRGLGFRCVAIEDLTPRLASHEPPDATQPREPP
jgi:hypothetical protein